MRPSRPRFARHLRMTTLFNAIKGLRHGEERPGGAGPRLEPRTPPMQRNSCPASGRNSSPPRARPRRRLYQTPNPQGMRRAGPIGEMRNRANPRLSSERLHGRNEAEQARPSPAVKRLSASERISEADEVSASLRPLTILHDCGIRNCMREPCRCPGGLAGRMWRRGAGPDL